MNAYLNPPGFLGTGASLLADVTLLAYIFLILPAMAAGFYFARTNRHRPHHRSTMMAITLVNWVLILWLMVAALTFDVTANVGTQPSNPRYIFPAVHAAIGLTAQVLASYAVYRMVREDAQVAAAKRRGETDLQRYWFTSAKPVMRVVLILWFVAAALGILSYFFRYYVINLTAAGDGQPVATEEAVIVVTTAEASATGAAAETPTATVEVGATEEVAAAPTSAPQPATAAPPEETAETVVAVVPTEVTLAETQEITAPASATPMPPAVPTVAETAEVVVVETVEVTVAAGTEGQTPGAIPTQRPTRVSPTATAAVAPGAPLVSVAEHTRLGEILVGPNGHALYVYANDEPGWSNCVGDCLLNWRVYAVDRDTALVLGAGLTGELGLSERADGTFQVTYDDRPLYFFRLDRRAGDVNGDGAGNVWSVARPQ